MQAETGMTYERAAIRKWFFMGGDTCPLTGVRLSTTKVTSPLNTTLLHTSVLRTQVHLICPSSVPSALVKAGLMDHRQAVMPCGMEWPF